MNALLIYPGIPDTFWSFKHIPPDIFERRIKFIQNSGVAKPMIGLLNAPPGTRRMTLSGTTAFLNSILYLGILDKWNNKIYYWKLLLKALVFYRRSLREAVTLMIFGYHFRKLFTK